MVASDLIEFRITRFEARKIVRFLDACDERKADRMGGREAGKVFSATRPAVEAALRAIAKEARKLGVMNE